MPPYDKVKPGQPFAPPAAVWNEMLDGLAWIRGQRGGGSKAGTAPAAARRPLRWTNWSDTTCPRGGIFRIDNFLDITNDIVAIGRRPDEWLRPIYGVALHDLKQNEIGAYTLFDPVEVLFHEPDGPPVGTDSWGPVNDQWYVRRHRPGFTVLDYVDDATRFKTIQTPVTACIAKPAATIAAIAGTTLDHDQAEIYAINGTSLAATGLYIDLWNPTEADLESTKYYSALFHVWEWIATSGATPPTTPAVTQKLVKTTSSIASGATGTCNEWTPGSPETITSGPATITGKNRTSASIPSGKFCLATLLGGIWYLEVWEC